MSETISANSTDNMKNFVNWFKKPLASLYKNNDAGFIILMATFPLLERYLRQKSGLKEAPKLNDDFYKAFIKIFPIVSTLDTAKIIWQLFRNGLLHQATPKIKIRTGDTVLEVGAYDDTNEIDISYNKSEWKVKISPTKFSIKVISIIENDFPTFESPGSPNHPLATVGETGVSGWESK